MQTRFILGSLQLMLSVSVLCGGYALAQVTTLDFRASPRVGHHSQVIAFTSFATATAPGEFTYSWDFDADGAIDSTQEEPSFVYPGPGIYDVSLTVHHPVLGNTTVTKTAYVILGQQDIYVDGSGSCPGGAGTQANPFCTIGDAVLTASPGDRVLVAPGTYNENLLIDKSLQVVGAAGPGSTVVRGLATSGQRTLTITSGTVADVSGLTVTQAGWYSGGIQSTQASLSLRDCVVTGNRTASAGAGILATGGEVYLLRTNISNNSTLFGYYGAAGGGMFVSGAAIDVTDSSISGNRAVSGAGLYVDRGTLTLRNSTVSGNLTGSTGCRWCDPGSGGGIRAVSADVHLLASRISENDGAGGGGGLEVWGGDLVVKDCMFVNNVAWTSGYYRIGYGGALQANGPATVDIDRTTMVGNAASGRGGAISGLGTQLSMSNSIVFRNTSGYPSDPVIGAASVIYSNVEGGHPGAGNIANDPLFVNEVAGDYRLQSSSPCIDIGLASFLSTERDIDGNPRVLDGDLDQAMRLDMGAHEFSHARLAVHGTLTPGGQVTFETTGTNGLPFLCIAGILPGRSLVPPLGTLFLDLTAFWPTFHAGTIPDQYTLSIPSTIPTPVEGVFQAIALSPMALAGNASNSVRVVIR